MARVFHPFDLSNDAAYRAWRDWKLTAYPRSVGELLVPLRDPRRLTPAEHAAILQRCRKTNLAFYQVAGAPVDKEAIRALGRQFGLERLDMNLRADEDSITTITVVPDQGGTHYIPYTSKALNWHTDGYYNPPAEQVRGIVMHCVAEAASGGDNLFLDPEIAYIRLRDENPGFVRALMQPDVMTIPANREQGNELRAAQSGPVFALEKRSHALHMRYTARTRSIEWKEDPVVRQAVALLRELLDTAVTCRQARGLSAIMSCTSARPSSIPVVRSGFCTARATTTASALPWPVRTVMENVHALVERGADTAARHRILRGTENSDCRACA